MPNLLTGLRGKRVLFIASTGGHLAQLVRLSESIGAADSSLWVTFDKPQSQSLLKDLNHLFIPYIAPRDFLNVFRGIGAFRRVLRHGGFDAVVSTGAGIALASHWQSVLKGIPTVYIESVSRYDGPSLTGRMIAHLPQVQLRTQHEEWADGRWKYEFSVMDSYRIDESWTTAPTPKKIFVTLGTIRPFRFDALVDAVLRVLPAGAEVVWQLGVTDRNDLPGKVFSEMSAAEFDQAAIDSDLVITHSGAGTIMKMLDLGLPMLVVPRCSARQEHVDDHQRQVARDLSDRGLCVVSEVPEITAETLRRAASLRVIPKGQTD